MRIPNSTAWGVGLAVTTALISGVSVYLTGQYVKLFDDPTLLAAVRNGLVGLVLAGASLAACGTSGQDPAPAPAPAPEEEVPIGYGTEEKDRITSSIASSASIRAS